MQKRRDRHKCPRCQDPCACSKFGSDDVQRLILIAWPVPPPGWRACSREHSLAIAATLCSTASSSTEEESLGCCDTSQMPPKSTWQWYTVVGLGLANVVVAVGEIVVSSLDDFVNFSNLIVGGGALIGAVLALWVSCHWTRSSILVLQCGQIICIVAVP